MLRSILGKLLAKKRPRAGRKIMKKLLVMFYAMFGLTLSAPITAQEKVLICHKGRTLMVAEASILGHAMHGDSAEECASDGGDGTDGEEGTDGGDGTDGEEGTDGSGGTKGEEGTDGGEGTDDDGGDGDGDGEEIDDPAVAMVRCNVDDTGGFIRTAVSISDNTTGLVASELSENCAQAFSQLLDAGLKPIANNPGAEGATDYIFRR
jgi:hypothetical protein